MSSIVVLPYEPTQISEPIASIKRCLALLVRPMNYKAGESNHVDQPVNKKFLPALPFGKSDWLDYRHILKDLELPTPEPTARPCCAAGALLAFAHATRSGRTTH